MVKVDLSEEQNMNGVVKATPEITSVQAANGTINQVETTQMETALQKGEEAQGQAQVVEVETAEDKPEPEKEYDPWGITETVRQTDTPWSELTTKGRVLRVLSYISRVLVVLTCLYFFICSLDFLTSAFRLLGGRAAGDALTSRSLLDNPVAGLMIGVLVTVLLQSSSTSTSITVTMVASGLITLRQGIPIIMGANIGTSVTNTIVSLAQSGDRDEFRRAFAGATVHDSFNWLTVIILLPLEAASRYLERLSGVITENLQYTQGQKPPDMLKALTRPFTNLIVQIDSKVIEAVATKSDLRKRTMLKYWCKETKYNVARTFTDPQEAQQLFNNATGTSRPYYWAYDVTMTTSNTTNLTTVTYKITNETASTTCSFLFHGQGTPWSALSEAAVGAILLLTALTILIVALITMVKVLQSLLGGPLALVVKRVINAEFPGYAAFLTGYLAIIVGAGLTIVVQSSSVFTSTLPPLVGLGMITLDRMYPLTLGSNIGTTITGILAALVATQARFRDALRLALCHLFFNISGIIIFYPIPPLRRIPIRMAKGLGTRTAKYRWFAVMYLILMFFFLPLIVFGLSMAGWPYLVLVASLVVIFLVFIAVVTVLQRKRPEKLPEKLRSWNNIPVFTLDFYDRGFTFLQKKTEGCRACKCCPCKKKTNSFHVDVELSTEGKGATNMGYTVNP